MVGDSSFQKPKLPELGLTLIAYSNATAYTQNVMQIKDINVRMTYNAVHATDALCSDLEFVVLQTGTNVSQLGI